jgi:hypothetical protein
MTVNRDRDDSGAADPELTNRYRQASAQVDERPAASTRASILAAAAREVGARPVDAAAPFRTPRRWPLAAAAAVMLSTLAVMLAIRTNEEMPQFSAPPESARSATETETPPAKIAAAPPMADQPPSERKITEQPSAATKPERAREERAAALAGNAADSAPQVARDASPPALARNEADAVAQAPREPSRPALTEAPSASLSKEHEQARQNAPAALPASPAPEPANRAKQRSEQPAAGAAAPTPPMDQAAADARRDAAKPAATAPLSALESGRRQAEESAAAWLERIIKLRREGRHDEAEAELKRFRERYPQVQPPSEALPPAGTR